MDQLQHRSDPLSRRRPKAPHRRPGPGDSPLDVSGPDRPAGAIEAAGSEVLQRKVMLLADALLSQDHRAVDALLRRSLTRGWWRTCEELVAPAARETGERWSRDACSFLDVTLGVGLLHRTLRSLAPEHRDASAGRGRILITCAPGAQHTLGMLLTAERMRRAGWEVDLGWPFCAPPLPGQQRYDAYGVSVSGPREHTWASEWSAAVDLAAPSAIFLVGGAGAARLARETGVVGRGAGDEATFT